MINVVIYTSFLATSRGKMCWSLKLLQLKFVILGRDVKPKSSSSPRRYFICELMHMSVAKASSFFTELVSYCYDG